MNKKLEKRRATNSTASAPKFKTRLDAVCYNQAVMKDAIHKMLDALRVVEPKLTVSECRFKLFISFALPREEFSKPKRFLVYVSPKDEIPDWNDVAIAASYLDNFQLGRVKIKNDFGHSITVTAYTVMRMKKRDDFMAFLGKIVIDDMIGAVAIADAAFKSGITSANKTESNQNVNTGSINLFWHLN